MDEFFFTQLREGFAFALLFVILLSSLVAIIWVTYYCILWASQYLRRSGLKPIMTALGTIAVSSLLAGLPAGVLLHLGFAPGFIAGATIAGMTIGFAAGAILAVIRGANSTSEGMIAWRLDSLKTIALSTAFSGWATLLIVAMFISFASDS